MRRVLLLDGRAHGHILSLPDLRQEANVAILNGKPQVLVSPEDPRFKDQLNAAYHRWELYARTTGLGPNTSGEHAGLYPFDCRRRLPDPQPADSRRGEPLRREQHWLAALRGFLERLDGAPPPTDLQNVYLWVELTDILPQLHTARQQIMDLRGI